MSEKLRNSRGETLVEVLASVLICALSVMLLLGAVSASKSYRLSGTTYGKTETYLAPKKDTYLVPDKNGFKVETERGWEEKTYTDGSYTRTEISGYYCAEHTEAGENLILSGIRHARMRSNVFGKTVVVIVTMFPWLWMLIGNMRAKRKAAKAQKSSTNSKV